MMIIYLHKEEKEREGSRRWEEGGNPVFKKRLSYPTDSTQQKQAAADERRRQKDLYGQQKRKNQSKVHAMETQKQSPYVGHSFSYSSFYKGHV